MTALGKGNWYFWGLMDTVFELKLIPGDTTSLCPLFRMGAYGGQVNSGILALIHLVVILVVYWTYTVVISLVLEYIIAIDMLSSWQNFCPGSPNYGVIVIMVGKTKWKLLELPLPEGKKKKSKAKAMLHSWELQGLPSSRSWRIWYGNSYHPHYSFDQCRKQVIENDSR